MRRLVETAPAREIETHEFAPHLVEHCGSVWVRKPVSEEPHCLLVSVDLGLGLDSLKSRRRLAALFVRIHEIGLI